MVLKFFDADLKRLVQKRIRRGILKRASTFGIVTNTEPPIRPASEELSGSRVTVFLCAAVTEVRY